MTAMQMADGINNNFDELYRGGGGGSATVETFITVLRISPSVKAVYNYPVKSGEVYKFCKCSGFGVSGYNTIKTTDTPDTSVRKQTLFDDFNSPNVNALDTEITITEDAEYIVASSQSHYLVMMKKVTMPAAVAQLYPNLFGKKWLLIGDSISTEYETLAYKGYGTYVADYFGMGKVNIASAGKTVLTFLDWVGDDYQDIYGDYDVVTVMLGANDKAFGCQPGAVNDSHYQYFIENGGWGSTSGTDDKSYCARLQVLYERLRRLWPSAMIVFITPIHRYTGSEISGTDFAQAMKDVCTYYQIPCIDINESISPYTLLNRKKLFNRESGVDGSHPNMVGHSMYIGPVVKAGFVEAAQYYKDWYTHFPTDDEPTLGVLAYANESEDAHPVDVSSVALSAAGSKTLYIRGINLTADVQISVSGSHWSVDKSVISDVAAMVTPELVVTYDGQATETATLTLSSTGVNNVVITLNGTA